MTTTRSKSFVSGFCVGAFLAFGINLADYLDWYGDGSFCLDCKIQFGVPFDMYFYGGFITLSGFMWKGLLANIICWVIFSLGMGWIFQQAASVIASFRKS